MKTVKCMLGIAGASGSGKSTLSRAVEEHVGRGDVVAISMDSYYRDLSHLSPEARACVDFDNPAALDLDLLVLHLAELKCGRTVEVPHYDFATHTRGATGRVVEPRPLVLVEGLFCLAHHRLSAALDLRVYVESPEPVCLQRRLERDVRARGRTESEVRAQYDAQVAPALRRIVLPSRQHAHLVVPGTAPVQANVDLIAACLRIYARIEMRPRLRAATAA